MEIPMPWPSLTESSHVYVADAGNRRIQKFTTAGLFDRKFGMTVFGASGPGGIAWDPAGGAPRLYATDPTSDRVRLFSSTGAYQTSFGSSGSGNGQLDHPTGIAVSQRFFFVADSCNYRVCMFDRDGTYLAKLGSVGTGPGQFNVVSGVEACFDDSAGHGYVVVSDIGLNRLQRLRVNHSPTAPRTVAITASPPGDNNMLRVSVSGGGDPDPEDASLSKRYQWYNSWDGSTWTPYSTAATISSTLTSPGQFWKVRVRYCDGPLFSPWKMSAPVRVYGPGALPALVTATAAQTAAGVQISLSLSGEAEVSGSICNLAGREVAVLPASAQPSGSSSLLWHGKSTTGTRVPAGQYLVRLTVLTADGQQASALARLQVR